MPSKILGKARGKSKKAAGGALARKLACLVYAILSSGERWKEEIALESIQRGNKEAPKTHPLIEKDVLKTGHPILNLTAHSKAFKPKGKPGSTHLPYS